MSAPDTNLDTQEERHKGPLVGIPAAIILASVLFLGVLAVVTMTGADENPVPAVETAATTQ